MKIGTLCYVRHNGKTLMIHRNRKENDMHKGKWNGLGGKFEQGEGPEECVIREIREESGLNIKNPIMNGIMTFPAFDGIEDWYVFVFTATKFTGKLIKESREGDIEWIDNSKLLDLPLWEGDKVFFKWMDEKRFFSAKFIYKDGKLQRYVVSFY